MSNATLNYCRITIRTSKHGYDVFTTGLNQSQTWKVLDYRHTTNRNFLQANCARLSKWNWLQTTKVLVAQWRNDRYGHGPECQIHQTKSRYTSMWSRPDHKSQPNIKSNIRHKGHNSPTEMRSPCLLPCTNCPELYTLESQQWYLAGVCSKGYQAIACLWWHGPISSP